MSTTRQGITSASIDHIVAQRVTDVIKVIAVYEEKIRMAHDSMNQVVHQGTIVVRNANNKRNWGSDHGKNSGWQQNKRREVLKANTAGPGKKKRDCWSPIAATSQRTLVENQKATVTYYECGKQEHYKSDCPKLKNQNHVNQSWKIKAYGNPNAVVDNTKA
nr:hypothetical protein [Tanacetum cinerariifolium]